MTPTPPEPQIARFAELLSLFRVRELRRLVGAFFVAELGDGIVSIVLPLAVYAGTSNALLTGAAFAAVQAVNLLAQPVGGLLADRIDRVAVLRVTYFARIVVLAVVLGFGAVGDPIGLVGVFVIRVIGVLDNPSAEASIRVLARSALRQVATIRKIAFAVSWLLGPAIGGLLISAGGVRDALMASLTAFSIGTVGLIGVRSAPASRRETMTERSVRSLFAEATRGIRHIRSDADLRLVAFSAAVNSLIVGAILVVAVVYLASLSDAPTGAYGLAIAAYSAGSIAGLAGAGTIRWRISIRALVGRSMIIYGLLCVCSVLVARWEVLAGAWLLWGIAYGPEEILSDVVLVDRTPDQLLGRVYAGMTMTVAGSDVVGALVGGALASVFDPRIIIGSSAGVYLLVVARLWATR